LPRYQEHTGGKHGLSLCNGNLGTELHMHKNFPCFHVSEDNKTYLFKTISDGKKGSSIISGVKEVSPPSCN